MSDTSKYVILIWQKCDSRLTNMQFLSDKHVINFWQKCDSCLTNMRFSSDKHAILIWQTCVPFWQTCDSLLTKMWFPFDKNVIPVWLAIIQWFSPGTLVSSTNKTVCHDIVETLLIVALNTITLTPLPKNTLLSSQTSNALRQ